MSRTRITSWLLAVAVVAVVAVAAVDAIFPADEATRSSLPTSATTAGRPETQLPECTRREIGVSMVVRDDALNRRVVTVVAHRIGTRPCHQPYLGFELWIRDRVGRSIGNWKGALFSGGDASPGTTWSFSLPDVWTCRRPGPYVAVGKAGPYTARLGNLSRTAITC